MARLDASEGQDGPPQALAYRRRLLAGGSLPTRLSHRRRMDRALSILDGRSFARAADVGAADGWYLQELIRRGEVGEGLAIERDPDMIAGGAAVSATMPLTWARPDDPVVEAQRGTFDLVACLETLEHVDDPFALMADVVDLAAPGGTILISVPVEVGPSLLVKQTGRWMANRKGDYGYERYTWQELCQAGVFGRVGELSRVNLHSHKGFDYRRIAAALGSRVDIERTVYGPVHVLGPVMASTVYWVTRRPRDPT